jgi:tetratricopeptide (TPR) repeat protein
MTYIKIALIALAATFHVPAIADQSDPRLNGLFERLKGGGLGDARPTEQQIWSIWHEISDKQANLILQDGLMRMRTGELKTALRVFTQLVETDPDFAEGWNKRATVNYLLGNLHLSLADIERTLALEPRHFGALAGQGLVYIQLQDLEKAVKSFERAIEIHPNLSGPRQNLEAIKDVLKSREI